MSVGDTIRKNLEFWHWYPRMLCDGLTDDQLHWQPEGHPNHIMYTLWHAYRSEDDLIHSLLIGRPGVFARDEWAARLPVEATGRSPFGNGLDRQGIAAVRLSLDAVLDYAAGLCRAGATPRLPHRGFHGHRRRPAAEPCEVRDGGIGAAPPASR